jgi:hypothetical protein
VPEMLVNSKIPSDYTLAYQKPALIIEAMHRLLFCSRAGNARELKKVTERGPFFKKTI